MYRSMLVGSGLATLAVLIAGSWMGTAEADKKAGYIETDLITNKPSLTDKNGIVHPINNPNAIVDGKLQNPWGLTSTPTSPFWVSDNASGVSTLYNVPSSNPFVASNTGLRVVTIPAPGSLGGGAPTGAVFNSAQAQGAFMITGFLFTATPKCSHTTAVATFLFATEDGTIVGWNANLYPTQDLCNAGALNQNNNAIIAVDNSAISHPGSPGAVYKGLAIGTIGTEPVLYATNFRGGRVEVFTDTDFAAGSGYTSQFTDPNLPGSYAPFNVVPVTLSNGTVELFVTFAVQDAAKHDDVAGQGHGIVDIFDLSGDMLQRFAQHGQLDSPWGVALAPDGFGELADTIWIGNFGNGQINAYDSASGRFVSKVRGQHGQAIVIDGLWSLKFGSGVPTSTNGGSSQVLYFTAGPNDEMDGLFGTLTPNPN
jgi:uncharacterized protein (TIGR03118 family)